MKYINFKEIDKEDFLKLDEKDVLFITNPGRMGDEDGSNFIIKKDNKFYAYRVSGWMYGGKKISLDEFSNHFPLWMDMWRNAKNLTNEKYHYIYMGFGNGLSIDNSIYDEYYPYFDKALKSDEKYEEDENGHYPSHLAYSSWLKALINMCNEKKYELK